MLHAYCIRGSGDPNPAPELIGVGGAPVRSLVSGNLAIWVSTSVGAPATAESLRQHEGVVRSALRSATPLPLRFGALFTDDTMACKTLVLRHEEFERQLARFADQVEMGIRIARVGPPDLQDSEVDRTARGDPALRSPGRAYLEARKRDAVSESTRRQRIEASMARVEAQLAELELPTVRTILAGDPPIGSVAHLVQRAQLSPYRRRVADLQERNPDLLITASGPWAPYSFVE